MAGPTIRNANECIVIGKADVDLPDKDRQLSIGNAIKGDLDTGNIYVTKGTFTYKVKVIPDGKTDVSHATVVLDTTDCYNAWRINDGNSTIDYFLPGAVIGMSVCFYAKSNQIIKVNVGQGDEITLDGVDLGVGNSIHSAGNKGDAICLLAIDNKHWITNNKTGVWKEE